MRLHDYPLSGNCYKVRLLLHWLDVPHETVPVDFHPGREHRSARFLADVNPLGQLPVLDLGDRLLADSGAILMHLAEHHDPSGRWRPAGADQPMAHALELAEGLTRSVATARLHLAFGLPADLAECQRGGRSVLRALDDTLAERTVQACHWLAADHPTLADIACFPYAALAGEAGIDLMEFVAVRAWIDAFRHLDGFIPMPGILPPLPRPTAASESIPAKSTATGNTS